MCLWKRRVVINEDTVTIAPRPWLQSHIIEVGHVNAVNDVQALGLDPARIGRFLFFGELLDNVFGDNRFFIHTLTLGTELTYNFRRLLYRILARHISF